MYSDTKQLLDQTNILLTSVQWHCKHNVGVSSYSSVGVSGWVWVCLYAVGVCTCVCIRACVFVCVCAGAEHAGGGCTSLSAFLQWQVYHIPACIEAIGSGVSTGSTGTQAPVALLRARHGRGVVVIGFACGCTMQRQYAAALSHEVPYM